MGTRQVVSVLTVLVLLCAWTVTVLGQSPGDYRSAASGNWSDAASWETYVSGNWVPATTTPTSADGAITIQSGHTVTVTADITEDSVFVSGGLVIGSGVTYTVPTPRGTARGGIINTGGSVVVGGTYRHDRNGGSIPVATWGVGSTCMVTGYVSGSKPGNANQGFYNFVWSCTGQTANVDLGMSGNTIRGDFTVNSTGASRVYLTSPTGYSSPITINGSLFVTGGQFSSNGSGSAATMTVNTLGSIVVTGGNFGVSRGSAPDVTWNLYGSLSVSNATLQNSGGTHVNKLSFAGGGIHNITLVNVTYGSGSSPFTMEVQNGSTLNMGTTVISSSNTGSFLLLAGGTLLSGDPGGIDGNVQCTGASNGGGNHFDAAANYAFNGSVAQVTGTKLPATVNNLTIGNASGVTLTSGTTVNDALSLINGALALNGQTVTLGPTATLSENAGSAVTGIDGFITTTRTLTAPEVSNDIAGLGISIGSGADLGPTIITRGHSVHVQNANSSIKRYFEVTPTMNSGLDARLVFKYDESELNGLAEERLTLFKSQDNGATWQTAGGVVDPPSNTITLTGIDAFSRWTAGDIDAPLPIQLVSFTGTIVNDHTVRLDWRTLSELNNYGFWVQKRQQNESGWSEIAGSFVAGHGTTNEPRQYSFTDDAASVGAWQYRLKQVDLDGSIHFAEPILVNVLTSVSESVPLEFALMQNYPNPFNPSTEIRFFVEKTGRATLELYDLLGRKVMVLFDGVAEAGRTHAVTCDGSSLPSGMYLYRLHTADKVDVKRMMVLK